MAQSLIKQCENFGKWIWPELNTDIRTINYGKSYGIAEISESGSIIQTLTPFMDVRQLLGYLQGLHAAKNNPNIFNR